MTESKELLLDVIGSLTDEQCNALYDAAILTAETKASDMKKLITAFYVASILMRTTESTVSKYARIAAASARIEQN